MQPRVAIIVLNYNKPHDTIECVRSLEKIRYPNAGVLVVDNGSTDTSVDAISAVLPGTEIIETGNNLGFAGGNNLGIQHALARNPEYILLLNNDTLVEPGFLEPLVSALESDDSVAMSGGMICYHPRTETIWYGGGRFVFWKGTAVHLHMDRPATFRAASVARDVSFITGCMMLIRTKVLKQAGLLNENFFMYSEDVEFSHRLVALGHRLRYVPESRIYHKIHHGGETPFTVYYGTRSRFTLIETCLHGWKKALATLYVSSVTGLKLVYWRKRMPELFRAANAGWRDYRRGIVSGDAADAWLNAEPSDAHSVSNNN